MSKAKIDPQGAKDYNDKGLFHAKQKCYAEAFRCFDKAEALDPDNADIHYNRGLARTWKGNYGMAIRCFERAWGLRPNDVKIYDAIGMACYRLGCYYFEQADTYNTRYSEYMLPNFERARRCFEKARKLDPKDWQAYHGIGLVIHAVDNTGHNGTRQVVDVIRECKEALRCFKKAIALNPSNAEIYNDMGLFYYDYWLYGYDDSGKQRPDYKRSEHYVEAIRCFEKAVALAPTCVEAWKNIAESYKMMWFSCANNQEKLTRYATIIRCYETAIALCPTDAEMYYELGDAYYGQQIFSETEEKDYSEALRCYNKAVELDPECAKAYHDRGDVYHSMGQEEAARRDWDKADSLGYY